ncbi:branched-chain amino acid ABC transporter substrate-binding protein [Desulfosarcina alkanivorans]|uniref:Branched-chain amino acid ABC transporter substrate-binding protein n=1 Tax=Desulfosarcina alkanivorans TaxID=571177 RepID=A0A5K7YE33_9BACT|nr:ABC transporter substrate-binding protein [Desulfosarcina alkanivorans]BBO66250.1 branched-chain amino acid ABC transporter substrate-binding protein [Desulfosarcina alkanivorans]
MKRFRIAKAMVLMLLTAALAVGFAGTTVLAGEKVIKIGTLFPLTGPCALAGQRCQASVATAAEVINNQYPDINVPLAAQKGILDGYRIELVHADHQGKPDVGKSEAERLFNQEGVYAIIGSYNSSVTKPASFVAERKKKIFMCGCSSSAALTKRKFKRFFRMAPTDETESMEFVEVTEWLNHAGNAGLETVGLIYENSEFGKHAADEGKKAAKAAGFKIVADVPFSPGATNLNSEVRTLKANDPDVIYGACLGGDYTLWVRTMKQMNWLPKVAMNYCTGYQDPVITKQLGPDANYFMGGTGYSPEFAELMPAVAAVEKIYKKKTNPSVPFDSDSIQEAVAMFVLAQAIEKAGTLDHEKVAQTLYANEWESPLSLGGKVAFAEGGQNIKAKSLITQLQGGAYKRVFPADLADTRPVFPMIPWGDR